MLKEQINFSHEISNSITKINMSTFFRDTYYEVSFQLPAELAQMDHHKGIYTADIGNYSGLNAFIESANNNSDIVFINFCDYSISEVLPSNIFNVRVNWTGSDPRFVGKFFKLLPHIFLDNFQNLLWIDSNMILEPMDAFFESSMSYDFVCLLHDKRVSIPSEVNELILHGKDDKKILDEIIPSYSELIDGFEKIPLLAGRFLLRKSNERVQNFNSLWFSLLVNGSIRDQLSLPIAERMSSLNSLALQSTKARDLFKVIFHKKYDVSKYGKGFLSFLRSYISKLKYKLAKLKYVMKNWLNL